MEAGTNTGLRSAGDEKLDSWQLLDEPAQN